MHFLMSKKSRVGIGATFFAKIRKIKINNFMIFRKRMMNDIIGNA